MLCVQRSAGIAERIAVALRWTTLPQTAHMAVPVATVDWLLAASPGYRCEAALADGRLVRILPAWTPITKFGERIHAVASPERGRIARNRALIEFLRLQLGGAGVLDPSTAEPPR